MIPRRLLLAAALVCAVPAGAQPAGDITAAVARVLPTVVQVSVARTGTAPRKPEAHADNDLFERFLRPQQTGPRVAGSGTVVGADGYVLTAAHLFEPDDSVTVRFADGRTLAATLVGRDRRSDVALLRIPAAGLVAAVPGDPRKLRLAERVFALGMLPSGIAPSVTDGIVSVVDADLDQAAGFIQTTVPLYPSMGGGPLFNAAGQLVGINAMIYARPGGRDLSFAIPIDDAMAVAGELRASGRVRRATLGLNVQEVTRDTAALYGMDRPAGALVQSVLKGSPAEQAGIATGDIVLRVGRDEVRSPAQIVRSLARLKPGERISVRVRRMKDVREEDLVATLGEAPD